MGKSILFYIGRDHPRAAESPDGKGCPAPLKSFRRHKEPEALGYRSTFLNVAHNKDNLAGVAEPG